MAEFIRRRERIPNYTYSLAWDYADEEGSGFSFVCDENGKPDLSEASDVGIQNYHGCLAGEVDGRKVVRCGEAKYNYVIRHPHYFIRSAIIRCACGAEVELHSDGVVCSSCGQTYNLVGQRLRPESEWEE